MLGAGEVAAAAVDGAGNVYMAGYFEAGMIFGSFTLTTTGASDNSFFLAKFDSNGTCLWAKAASGTGGSRAKSVVIDAAGNPILSGFFLGNTTFGTNNLSSAGSWDIFLAKFNTTGDVVWIRPSGGIDDDYGYGVAVDSGNNIFSVGQFRNISSFGSTNLTSVGQHDGYIARYNTDGQLIWVRPMKAQFNDVVAAPSLAVDTSGNAFIVGSFHGSVIFAPSNLTLNETAPQHDGDVFVVKYSNAGEPLWAYNPTGSGTEIGRNIVIDVNGSPYVTGVFDGPVNFGRASLATMGSTFLGKMDIIPATPTLSLQMFAGLLIQGTPSATYTIQYVSDLQGTNNWQPLTTIQLTNSSQLWFDLDSPFHPRRFYRSVP